MRYYFKAFKYYVACDGRASRKELWFFFLFHFIALFITSFIDGFFGLYPESVPIDYGYVSIAYLLASFFPYICVQVRRLHDINKSGSWWFLFNVPFVSLYVLYLYLKRGDHEVNDYGPPPFQKTYKQYEPVTQANDFSAEQQAVQYQSIIPNSTVDVPTEIKYCRKCGYKLIKGSMFCSKCGTAVTKE